MRYNCAMPSETESAVITLTRQGGVWTARNDGPETANIIELFGTATLPTPFRDTVPATTVLERIQRLNPGATVRIGVQTTLEHQPHPGPTEPEWARRNAAYLARHANCRHPWDDCRART